MELNINELDYETQNVFGYDQEPIQSSFEDIPENKEVKIPVQQLFDHYRKIFFVEEPNLSINQEEVVEKVKIYELGYSKPSKIPFK